MSDADLEQFFKHFPKKDKKDDEKRFATDIRAQELLERKRQAAADKAVRDAARLKLAEEKAERQRLMAEEKAERQRLMAEKRRLLAEERAKKAEAKRQLAEEREMLRKKRKHELMEADSRKILKVQMNRLRQNKKKGNDLLLSYLSDGFLDNPSTGLLLIKEYDAVPLMVGYIADSTFEKFPIITCIRNVVQLPSRIFNESEALVINLSEKGNGGKKLKKINDIILEKNFYTSDVETMRYRIVAITFVLLCIVYNNREKEIIINCPMRTSKIFNEQTFMTAYIKSRVFINAQIKQ